MKFTKNEYPLLWEVLKKNKLNESYALRQFHDFFQSYKHQLSSDALRLIIKNQQWDELPEIKITETIKGSYNKTVPTWFTRMDKKEFIELHQKFQSIGKDLILGLQGITVNFVSNSSYHSHEMDRGYVLHSQHFINNALNGNYPIDTTEKRTVLKNVLERATRLHQKDQHRKALGLLKMAIDLEFPQKEVLDLFKTFLSTNKLVNPNAHKHLEAIKSSIKNWNLTAHFNMAEQKALFGADNSGIVARKGDVLHYSFDTNTIKTKVKKSTATIVAANLRSFIAAIPEALGNIDDYIGETHTLREPEIQLSLIFEKGTGDTYSDAIDNLIENITSCSARIEPEHLKQLFKTSVSSSVLEKQLPQKLEQEESKVRSKNKI